jgi:hypothetical protein
VPRADEGVERLAALDKENAELKRRLANSAVAIEQAQKPVEVEKLVTDPALVAEVKQVWNVTNKRAACIGVVVQWTGADATSCVCPVFRFKPKTNTMYWCLSFTCSAAYTPDL